MAKKKFIKHVEKVYIPNEIFDDLGKSEKLKSSSSKAFAYSYYYYITYLYRYCKYRGDKMFTQTDIKEALGYSTVNKTLDYIMKKGGVLDAIGYTKTISDVPMRFYYDEGTYKPLFEMLSEMNNSGMYEETKVNVKNFRVKYPVKAFYRDGIEKDIFDGSYYNIAHTHEVSHQVFDNIIQNSGTLGAYVYGYVKAKSFLFNNNYQIPIKKFSDEIGISIKTLSEKLNDLEDLGHMRIYRQKYIHGKENQEANTYRVI